MPHPLAVLLVYIGLMLVFVGVGIVLFPQLANQLTDAAKNWNAYANQANQWVIGMQDWVAARPPASM